MTIGALIYGGPAVTGRQVSPEEIEAALTALAATLSNGSGICAKDVALLRVGVLHGLLCAEAPQAEPEGKKPREEKGGAG